MSKTKTFEITIYEPIQIFQKYKKMSLLCPCKMKLKKFLDFTIDNLCFKI